MLRLRAEEKPFRENICVYSRMRGRGEEKRKNSHEKSQGKIFWGKAI